MDELYTYIKKSQTNVWTAVNRDKLKFASFVVGSASKEICQSLLDKLKDRGNMH